jgi:hypothetical protein
MDVLFESQTGWETRQERKRHGFDVLARWGKERKRRHGMTV